MDKTIEERIKALEDLASHSADTVLAQAVLCSKLADGGNNAIEWIKALEEADATNYRVLENSTQVHLNTTELNREEANVETLSKLMGEILEKME